MKKFGLFLLLLTGIQVATAVTIVTCEDSKGGRTFEKACPPGTKEVGKKDYQSAAKATTTTNVKPELVLYRVADCVVCDQVKEFLTLRQIPYTETDVSTDITLQEKVKQLAGELQVPVLTIGETVIVGYNRPAMTKSLTESGYIKQE